MVLKMIFRDLEKVVISEHWLKEFREKHIARAFEVRLKGGLIKPRHPHRNYPYCNICDEDYEEWDVGYRLYVGGHPIVYHAECIQASWDTKKVKNILAQDRGFRRRLEGEKEAANELKVRAQLIRFVIGSVLDDTLGDNAPFGRDRPSLAMTMMPVVELEAPALALDIGGISERLHGASLKVR